MRQICFGLVGAVPGSRRVPRSAWITEISMSS
jgi:hypothetical protein